MPGHEPKGSKQKEHNPVGVVSPGSTGVIYCTERANANGFTADDSEWANFGQGAPEVGAIPGQSPRPDKIDLLAMGEGVNEYGPTTGIRELREAVANLYNVEYRNGKASQYTADNVCIVPGGRAGLTRIASVIGDVCLILHARGQADILCGAGLRELSIS